MPGKFDSDWTTCRRGATVIGGITWRGAVLALQQHYRLTTGLAGITQGRVSEGGLSSSASVGVAYLLALEHVNELHVEVERNIAMERQIENDYLGLRIGILDQSAILLSRRDHLTFIDCARVRHEVIPRSGEMPPFAIVIVFSGVRKSLEGTDYNRRVDECVEAARTLLRAAGRGAVPPLLGNVAPEIYAAHRHELHGPFSRRARRISFRKWSARAARSRRLAAGCSGAVRQADRGIGREFYRQLRMRLAAAGRPLPPADRHGRRSGGARFSGRGFSRLLPGLGRTATGRRGGRGGQAAAMPASFPTWRITPGP